MRSLGFNSFFLLRIFVYEALILVVSCSFSGLLIGTFIGNIMMLQHSLIEGTPFEIEFPFK